MARQLREAINAQQPDTALDLFASDAVVNIEGSAPFSGKGEIQVWLGRMYADHVELAEATILTQDVTSFRALYLVTTSRASNLGLASLEGTGEITTNTGRITALSFSLSEESRARLRQAQLDTGRPVLSYAVLTDPNPLRASPGSGDDSPYDPNLAALTVAITNDTRAEVSVRSISLRLPEGYEAGDLTPNISGVNSEAPDHWHLTMGEGRFALAPELPEHGMLEPGQGLFITLSKIEVNHEPGVWGLEITEETDEATQAHMTIQLAKFPFALYVSDLMADPLVVESGGTTTLYWNGSDGAIYSLSDGDTEIPVNHSGSHQFRHLAHTTTFYLTAELVGGGNLPAVLRERTITVLPTATPTATATAIPTIPPTITPTARPTMTQNP